VCSACCGENCTGGDSCACLLDARVGGCAFIMVEEVHEWREE
jgi:hypothetical protein